MAEPTQRHAIFPSIVVSAPEDYPDPDEGSATRWTLTTPEKEPVGILVFNDGGVEWTPALTEDVSAQAHGAELLQYLRGHRLMEAPLEEVLEGIREAYTGDLTEESVRFTVEDDEAEALAALEDDALFSLLADGSAVFAPGDDFSETVCVMAVPPEGWEGNGIGPEEKHATLLYFGKMSESADPDRIMGSKALFQDVLGIAAMEQPPFTAKVTGIEALGDEGAQVWLLDSPELQHLFGEIPEIDSEVASMYEDAAATRYPEYLPHVTIGYTGDDSEGSATGESVSEEDMARAQEVTEIPFDRLSLWWGNEHVDFPLGSADFFLMDQPRAPEGTDSGGQWIKPGGGSAPAEDEPAAPAKKAEKKGPTEAEKKAAAAKAKAKAEAELDRLMDRLDGLLDKLDSPSSRDLIDEIGKERTAHRAEKDPIKAEERVERIRERIKDLVTAERENLTQAELEALEKSATALSETELKEQKDD